MTHQMQYLTFHLAGEEYAIDILQVKEIIEYDALTKVPMTPPWVRGVINLRGSVVAVIDLAVKFGHPESPVGKRTCIVIVEVDLGGERSVMGIMADAVSQVMALSPEQVTPPPAFGTKIRTDYLKGMGKAGKKFVLILDADRVLSADELQVVASLQEAAGSDPRPAEEREPGR